MSGKTALYSQVPLQRGLIYHVITYDTAITVTESESDIGELWGVSWEDFREN